MGQPERMAELVYRDRVKVHPLAQVRRVFLPIFVLIEVDISTVRVHFVRIEGVGQHVPRTVERVAASKKKKKNPRNHVLIDQTPPSACPESCGVHHATHLSPWWPLPNPTMMSADGSYTRTNRSLLYLLHSPNALAINLATASSPTLLDQFAMLNGCETRERLFSTRG